MPACLPDYYWKLIFFTCLTLFHYYHPKPFVSLRPFNIDRQQKKNYTNKFLKSASNISRDNIISSIKETFFLLILLQSHGSIPRTPSRVLTGKYNHTVILRRDEPKLCQTHVIFISGSLVKKVIVVHRRIQCCRTPKTCTHRHKTSYLAIGLQPPPQKKKPTSHGHCILGSCLD